MGFIVPLTKGDSREAAGGQGLSHFYHGLLAPHRPSGCVATLLSFETERTTTLVGRQHHSFATDHSSVVFLDETMRIYGACRLNLCAPPGSVKVHEISARKLLPLQLLL